MENYNNKNYVLIARGNAHIRYFKRFAQASSLNISVVKINSKPFLPTYFRYTKQIDSGCVDMLVEPHLRKKAQKHPMLARSVVWPLFCRLSRCLIRLNIAKSAALIDTLNADVVGVWNGQKQPSAAIATAAKLLGKEVVYFENGLFPNSTTCDWKGVNCENSLPRHGNFYRQFSSNASLPTALVPRAPIASKAKGLEFEALPPKFIFVPFQVETDSQIISNSPWIKNMGQLYKHLVNIVEELSDPELHFVVKEHPSEPKRHDNLHHSHARVVFANQCNTQMLIERSQAVVTINSTVGLEALLLGKPVIALGKACYGIDGVCATAQSESDVVTLINHPAPSHGIEPVKKGFLNFMYSHYVIPTAWHNIDSQHVEALSNRLLKNDSFSHFISTQS